jgi:hypothetical protein
MSWKPNRRSCRLSSSGENARPNANRKRTDRHGCTTQKA